MMYENIKLDLISKKFLISENDIDKISDKLNNAFQKEIVKKVLIKKFDLTPIEGDVAVMRVLDIIHWKKISADLNMNYKYLANNVKKSIFDKMQTDSELGIAREIYNIILSGQKYD